MFFLPILGATNLSIIFELTIKFVQIAPFEHFLATRSTNPEQVRDPGS